MTKKIALEGLQGDSESCQVLIFAVCALTYYGGFQIGGFCISPPGSSGGLRLPSTGTAREILTSSRSRLSNVPVRTQHHSVVTQTMHLLVTVGMQQHPVV